MTDIAAIEARLSAALERIAEAVGRVGPTPEPTPAPPREPGPDPAELAALRADLAAEKAAHGQLAERIQAIRAKQDETVAQLEARVARLQARAEAQALETDRLRQVNAALRAAARQLREAVAAGAPAPGLIDAALSAELDATRAAQAADRAELESILSELTPLIVERADG